MTIPCIYGPKNKLNFCICLLHMSSKNDLKEQKILWLVAETVLEKDLNRFSTNSSTHNLITLRLTAA